MRGYFGIGVEGISKPVNLGTLIRTAHAFGASFVFTVGADLTWRAVTDTAETPQQVPFYRFQDAASMVLPKECALIGVEIADQAVDLPSFRHPRAAAYVLGSERDGLTPTMRAACAYLVRIPTRFSVNLGVAAAIVLYDRLLTLGQFGARPLTPGGPPAPLPPHIYGAPRIRARRRGGA
ncbi:MAG: TrmH family RNA methyltransferase [Alphaproteobacteria bacterium]|nr:TrmH family RNA methyltransferase [Alphaproteobacteria bacterium]